MWRVKEQYHSSCFAVKDSDYDTIKEFHNKTNANKYYLSVSKSNYKTVLEEKVNNTWAYRASNCRSEYA